MVAIRNGFRELQSELAAAEKALADTEKRMPHRQPPTNVEAEVEKAMALMDRIEAACVNPAAREDLNKLVQDLGIRIGLTFREGRRNNRSVHAFQSEEQIDRIETHVAGRRATLTGRSSNTSPTIRDRTVIQGKSGRPLTSLP